MDQPIAFSRIVGIIGHPTTPDVAWSDEQLRFLKEAGFETLQLSIAWASRPAGEVVNLEDLDEDINAREWARRIEQAHRFGFRTLAHFGLPVGPQAEATTCILDPTVRAVYAGRLREFLRGFPGVDEVMVYTYDQHAWLCSEFGPCPRCHGVPLHERLPGFLDEMVAAIQDIKPGTRLWWEPWELSAGQTLATVERVNPAHFGLILHNSIAEVQFINTTDLWFRNLAGLAHRRGIPVIGEGFFGGAGEDIHPLTHLPCPRLVYQQLEALRRVEGVVGVKEYYGVVPAHASVNLRVFSAYLRHPHTPLQGMLVPLAAWYGQAAVSDLLAAWEATAQAMELFPWDASWALRRVFASPPDQRWWAVPTASWMTPSWQANRRGFYLITDEVEQHPWLREDVGLRAAAAAEAFNRAALSLKRAVDMASAGLADVRRQLEDVRRAEEVASRLGESLLAVVAP